MPGPDITTDLHFPRGGIDLSQPFGRQPNRPDASGLYVRTTPRAINVRGYEPISNRTRGGSRNGIRKYVNAQVTGQEFIIQHLNSIATVNRGLSMQASQNGRVVSTVVVVEGQVYRLLPGATSFVPAVNATSPFENPPLNYSGLIRSAANNQKLWFADGNNSVVYDPAINTLKTWTASAGVLPTDSDGNLPTLIANWRGSIWLSGLPKDPQNLFGSKVGDATNWEYFPLSPGPADAIAGNFPTSFGLIGDVITSLIPFNDDTMVIGCDSEIHILRGDPRAGGQNDLVTTAIGMAVGLPWCQDPTGLIYFFSNRCGVFSMDPRTNQQPQRVSNGIENELQAIDTGANGVCMGWDDKYQGLYLWISPLAAPGEGHNYYYDQRNQAWFRDKFANPKHNPLVAVTFDGNRPSDRVLLIGSWDGYVRALDPTSTDDDGVPIASEVWIGPLLTKDLDDVTLKALQAVLGSGSGTVTYRIHTGATAEEALNSVAVDTGTWDPSRNLSSRVKWSDHAIYIVVASSVAWSVESIRAITTLNGKIRGRGR